MSRQRQMEIHGRAVKCLLVGLAALAVETSVVKGQAVGGHIPEVHGTALSGDKVDLPMALKGKEGVLVVGFSQASREQVRAWGKRLAEDYRESSKVIYYEMPQLAGVPRLVRGWVMKKISAEVPERAKARFLPMFDHEAEWRAVAGYGVADNAYVLVVDGDGVVRYRTEGAATDAAYGEVKRRVEGLGAK